MISTKLIAIRPFLGEVQQAFFFQPSSSPGKDTLACCFVVGGLWGAQHFSISETPKYARTCLSLKKSLYLLKKRTPKNMQVSAFLDNVPIYNIQKHVCSFGKSIMFWKVRKGHCFGKKWMKISWPKHCNYISQSYHITDKWRRFLRLLLF